MNKVKKVKEKKLILLFLHIKALLGKRELVVKGDPSLSFGRDCR